jgi:hypothetical protein
MKLKEIDFKKLKKYTEKLQDSKQESEKSSYIQSYPEFVEYFKRLDSIKEHHFFIGAHFVYGWMPTIPTLHTQKLRGVLEILNKAKKSKIHLNEQELEILKNCINRSMVGTSKLLHFINPKKYAIWDSRVLNYLNQTGNRENRWRINDPEDYLLYLDEISSISKRPGYRKIHALIEKLCGYPIEPMRAIEIIMFETERRKKKS